ncbi:hypothetical protein GQ600_21519 [Phytophthora cactorum]|nr:hypothetical protein GQ600_21519 [Phytophthora cactorum]
MAYGFTRPTEPSNSAQRQALLNASSATELLDVFAGQYAAPTTLTQSENAALTRPLDTPAIENADLGTRLNVAENQVTVLEADAKHSANHVVSLRKVIALSEGMLAKAVEIEKSKIKTLHQTIADKDAAYVTLQDDAAKHFEQLQTSARLLNSTNDPALRYAQAVVKDQRAVILRQKCIIQHQGFLPLHDPHMAAAAGAGLDLRRYAIPKSPMAGGSRRRPSAPPPPLPYDCPLPGEAGHEEISALLVSSLPQETMSDGDGLRSAKTSRRTRRKKTRRLQLS